MPARRVGLTSQLEREPVESRRRLVRHTLEWFRLGGETSERQWWDVVGVLRVTPDVDRAYLERWASALSISDLLARALTDAGANHEK